jgi:hypothetical protein
MGLALDTQYVAPLAFRPSFFLAFRSSLGKRRNIPSGETDGSRLILRACEAIDFPD